MICPSVLITAVCLLLDYCIVVLTVVVLHWADGCCVDVCTHWANGSLSLVHIWRWVVRNWHDSNSSTTQSRRLSLHQRSGTNPKGRRGETRSGHEWRRTETAKEEEWRENSRTQMSREGKEGERKKGSSVRKRVKETTEAESVRHKRPFIHSQYFCFRLTGITRMFLSMKILSASGVVGPLAPSAIIWQNKQKHRLPRHNGKKQESLDLLNESTVCMRVYLGFDLVCIPLGQLFLSSCRDQDVTVGLKKVSFVWGRVRKTNDGSILLKTERHV